MLTYAEVIRENEVLRALLQEGLNHGLHNEECAFTLEFDKDPEHVYDDSTCNCWVKVSKALLEATEPEIIVLTNPIDEDDILCKCTHPAKKHSHMGVGLCVAQGCDCFTFEEFK